MTNEILKLAKLSKLELSLSEVDSLAKDMQEIIGFADKINSADFKSDETAFYENADSLRDDEVCASYPIESILKNAPTHDDSYFKLPERG